MAPNHFKRTGSVGAAWPGDGVTLIELSQATGMSLAWKFGTVVMLAVLTTEASHLTLFFPFCSYYFYSPLKNKQNPPWRLGICLKPFLPPDAGVAGFRQHSELVLGPELDPGATPGVHTKISAIIVGKLGAGLSHHSSATCFHFCSSDYGLNTSKAHKILSQSSSGLPPPEFCPLPPPHSPIQH